LTDEAVIDTEAAAADLNRWVNGLGSFVAQRTAPLGHELVTDVQGRVPVLTGALKESVEFIEVDGGWAVGMGENLPYAGWIEFGGSRGRELVSAGRYLTPTAMEAQSRYEQAAEQAVEQSIETYPWTGGTP
jgi:hypothetical protein